MQVGLRGTVPHKSPPGTRQEPSRSRAAFESQSWGVAPYRDFRLRRRVRANNSLRGSEKPGNTFPPTRVPSLSMRLDFLGEVYACTVSDFGSTIQTSLTPAAK